MSIEWSASLSTGVGWQDGHHKELFKRINRLLDAMALGHGRQEVGRLFEFLDEYIVYHFEAEESAMAAHGYPAASSHATEHRNFVDDIGALRDEFSRGVSSGLVIKVQRQVVDWLVNHIGGPDRRLGEFLLSAGAEQWST